MANLNFTSFSNNTVADATAVTQNFQNIKNFLEANTVQVDGSVKATTASIDNLAVTTDKLADDSVTAAKVKDNETLPVNITGNAATATNATNANHALTANGANTANTATFADSATNATNATNLNSGTGQSTYWSFGSLNIYADVAAQYRFAVNGAAFLYTVPSTSGNNVLMFNSDGQIKYRTLSPWSLAEMKEDIKPITSALDKISSLKPRTFKFKEEVLIDGDEFDRFDRRTQTQYGFVIEEMLESKVPDVVLHYQKDDEGEMLPQSWKSHAVISLAVAAIQELSAKVDALQAELDSLKNV